MSARVRLGAHAGRGLESPWELCATPPGAAADPAALAGLGPSWMPVPGPSTAAAALRAAGRFSLEGPARRFDAEDWWWRTRFTLAAAQTLCLDGLATVAQVWLDGALVLESGNMFVAHRLQVPAGEHALVIVCRSLDAALGARRPRPRWRAPMVENQQLRWHRTTLLGRTPGWSPPAAPVGPWRPVRLEDAGSPVQLRARLDGDRARLEASGAAGELVLERHGQTWRGTDAVELPAVERWWPHTHGEPALYRAWLETEAAVRDLGHVGFREVSVDTSDGGFALKVNGARVFCRGACWTPLDPVSLTASREQLSAALRQVRDAGMNMLRVGGTMVYESDDFYDLADELGVLVWQDFMFANLDYPDDEAWLASVRTEARQFLSRMTARPSLAVLCGGSEVEQQAAMWGAPRELWATRLGHEVLPALARELCPDVPVWPSSAHGGAFPHQADVGTTSYYGVGAYLRPLEDARRAGVRFATECLAFANVPQAAGIADMPAGKVHHPGWKARTPRDLGAGWDFDDVRDHYVSRLFGVDPLALRYADHDRYLALGRVAIGEVMAATFAEWRRARSTCGGGLIWFLRDLWAGAGWGVVDAAGRPKSVWYYLKRALQPVWIGLGDEGGNGVVVHAANERPTPLAAELTVTLYRGRAQVGRGARAVELGARGAMELSVVDLLDGFLDVGHAYRFGPPACDLVVATLAHEGQVVARALHRPLGPPAAVVSDLGLVAEARPLEGGDLSLEIRADGAAYAVAIDLPGWWPDDDFVSLAPGDALTVRLRRQPGAKTPRGTIQAMNGDVPVRIQVLS